MNGLLFDIGQGIGLSSATGVRAFLPALLAGALARADAGIDFEGTGVSFLEAPWFLAVLLVLAVASFMLNRSGPNGSRPGLTRAEDGAAVVLGALLFGGSLAATGHALWPGLVAGAACAATARSGAVAFLGRAAERLDAQGGSPVTLEVAAQAAAVALAGLAIAVPPASLLALAFLVFAALAARRRAGTKYEGLRTLR